MIAVITAYSMRKSASGDDRNMLAALYITEPKRRLLSRKHKPSMVHSEIVTSGSGRFMKITSVAGKDGQPDWSEIRRTAGREAGRLLLPRGYTPPENSRILPFCGCALSRKLMTSAGLELLKIVAINPRLVQINIYDPQASMPDLPLYFLSYASDVRVITDRQDRYESQKFSAMKHYGAVLTVTDDVKSLSGSLLVLLPDGMPVDFELKYSRGLILSANNNGLKPIKGVIDGYIPRVSHTLLETMPPGCDVELFLAGLYELSGVNEIAEKPPEFLHMGGHTITLRDAAWRLAGIDIGISV